MPPPKLAPGRSAGRRRTPGLRREELAARAGMSLTWYTWLEQGRRMRISRRLLHGLSDALLLNRAETEYLFRLAGEQPPSEVLDFRVPPEYLSLLEHLDPLPASMFNQRLDILACNHSGEILFPHLGGIPSARRNRLRLAFLPEARSLFPDWLEEAAYAVALFRASAGERLAEPEFAALVDELRSGSREFRELWERGDLAEPGPSWRVFHHPELGPIRLNHLKMQTLEGRNTIIVHQPEPGSTLERQLADRVAQHRRARAAVRSGI